MFPHKIISGGQMGVDRAALDVALEIGIPTGGFLPRGRKDENGDVLPEDKYANMQETDTDDVNVRTELNVQNSDATLIFSHGLLFGGSEYTKRMTRKHGKPWLHVDFGKHDADRAVLLVKTWLADTQPRVLNVAGPRASDDPEIYSQAKHVLANALVSDRSERRNKMRVNIHPIKLGVDHCYIIQGEGTIMIDAGSPGQATRFRKAMDRLGIDPRSIRLILLTHGHWDHIGSARDIQEITGAKIAMHKREKDWLEKALKPLPPAVTIWGSIFKATMGVFLPLVRFPPTHVDVVLGGRRTVAGRLRGSWSNHLHSRPLDGIGQRFAGDRRCLRRGLGDE